MYTTDMMELAPTTTSTWPTPVGYDESVIGIAFITIYHDEIVIETTLVTVNEYGFTVETAFITISAYALSIETTRTSINAYGSTDETTRIMANAYGFAVETTRTTTCACGSSETTHSVMRMVPIWNYVMCPFCGDIERVVVGYDVTVAASTEVNGYALMFV